MSLVDTREIATAKIVMLSNGGGASSLNDLSDVNIYNVSNGQVLGFNSITGKWENQNGGGGYAGLGIGKKTSVSNNVIITDVDLHREPVAGDRLLIYFDATVQNPTGLTTYNNGTAVTKNLENAIPLYYNAGWNVAEFKNDGLLYNNVWARVQNVPVVNYNAGSGISISNNTIVNTRRGALTGAIDSISSGYAHVLMNGARGTFAAGALIVAQAEASGSATNLRIQYGSQSSDSQDFRFYDTDGETLSLSISSGNTIIAMIDNTGYRAIVLKVLDIEAQVGEPVRELRKLKIDGVVYDTDGMRTYEASNVANNNITLSVLNAFQFVQKVIAINTGAHSGSSSAWNLVISDGMEVASVALKNADGTAFADDIHENELLFVYVDTAGNVARVLGTAGASNEVYGAFNLLSKSEVAESVPYLYRRSGGAVRDVALEHLKKVVGASVAWNQLVQNGNFADGTTGWGATNGTISASNNVLTFTLTSGTDGYVSRSDVFNYRENHVIMCCATVKPPRNMDCGFYAGGVVDIKTVVPANTKRTVYGIVKASSNIQYPVMYVYMGRGGNNPLSVGDVVTIENVNAIDLTAMFGATIADYIYSLEQATSGSGIAKLKEWGFFSKDYYTYNTGALQSVKTSGKKCVGKNLTEKVLQNVSINSSAALENNNAYNICIARIIQGKDYIVTTDDASGFVGGFYYDEPTIGSVAFDNTRHVVANKKFTAPITGYVVYRTTASYTTPQIEFGITATAFEPYAEKTYPLSDVELRGLFKIDNNNNLYADGDEYTPDGNVKRKYGIVDLGSLEWNITNNCFAAILPTAGKAGVIAGSNPIICPKYDTRATRGYTDQYNNGECGLSINGAQVLIKDTTYNDAATFKTAMNGVYLIYELATPTTETTTPYSEIMLVDGDGTEEFLDSRDIPVPVGHESEYNQAIKGLPTAPTADGNYKLRCTVTNGMPSYSWVSDT